jgi:XTP/dITP diphosphohydrolase
MVLYACSSNQGKLNEFALAAGQSPVPGLELLPLPNIEQITPPEETGATFEENAAIKAVYYSGFTEELVFADDSGLEVDALGNEPGVFSARYAGAAATDSANNELVLNRLEHQLNRHGRFVCAIALAQAGKLITVVHGTVEGEVLEAAQGANGFGYDPLFFYPPLGCAFGELAPEDKFAVSHRGNALRALFDWLARNVG